MSASLVSDLTLPVVESPQGWPSACCTLRGYAETWTFSQTTAALRRQC